MPVPIEVDTLSTDSKPKCQHQFVVIEQVTRGSATKQFSSNSTAPDVVVPIRDIYGARVGCPLCGEVRTVWEDGSYSIENQAQTNEQAGE